MTNSNIDDYEVVTDGDSVFFNEVIVNGDYDDETLDDLSGFWVGGTVVSVSDLSVQPDQVVNIKLSNFGYLLHLMNDSGVEREYEPSFSSLFSHYAVYFADGSSDVVYDANCLTAGDLYNFELNYENTTDSVITEVVFNSFWEFTTYQRLHVYNGGQFNLFNFGVSAENVGVYVEVTDSDTGILKTILNYIQDIKNKISAIPTYLTDIKEKIQEIPAYLTDIKEKIQELPTYLTAIKEKIQELPTYLIEIKDKILGLPDLIAEKIKALFIPSDEAIQGMKEDFDDLLEDRFGAVYEVVDYTKDFYGLFVDVEASDVQEYIELPLLEVELAGAMFEFGGWQVDIIPDGFEIVVESVKWAFSAACSLALLDMLRRKFDYLLGGGSDAG